MTYISAALSENKKSVLVWEREENKIITKMYDAPYIFYVEDRNGDSNDIHGKSLNKLEFSNGYEFYEARKDHKERGIKMFESDINPVYKVLSQHYNDKPVGKLNFTLFDIEVDYDPNRGFSSPENPYAPVSAISIYHHHTDKMILLVILPDNGKWTAKDIPADLHDLSTIIVCKTEKELLLRFLDEIENSDIISGWNSAGFDVPYLYMRMLDRYGEDMANRLSFHNAPVPRTKEVEIFKGTKSLQVDIYGRVHIDYLEMFKKFETTTRPSFTLDAISEEILPNMTKLEYDGSLYDLYYDNFPHFCRYNVRDTEVLKGFEEALGYMEIAILGYHSASALMNDVLGTVKIVESTMIKYCHHETHVVVPDSKEQDYSQPDEKFVGALVLTPLTGMFRWVFSVDVNSLYPSTIRALNISPETIIGQFYNDYLAFEAISEKSTKNLTLILEDGTSETHPANEWGSILISREQCVSGYGTVFTQQYKGFIPTILEQWYNDRVAFKQKMKAAKKSMKEYEKGSEEYKKFEQEYAYYNRVQFIKKLLLNSAYGCMGNKYFKFYDLRMAESTTRSGQAILMHMVRTMALHLDGKYQYPSPSCIYGDTDSCYAIAPVDNIEDAVQVARIIERRVNESFPIFLSEAFFCIGNFKTIVQAELDTIADNSIFIKKKYYIMHLLYSDGSPNEKMKVMGLQVKKTTIPKPISKKLIGFLEELLKGGDWKNIAKKVVSYKDILINAEVTMIGLPKGIKKVEHYTKEYNIDPTCRLPGHVAAAMFYNKCLEIYNDKESPKIVSGMKMKTYYLTKKFDRFKSIALPTDTKVPPAWFMKHFAPLIDRKGQMDRLVDKPLQSVLTAIDEYAPTHKTITIDDIFEY